jgi:hypothetical protein
MGKKRKKKEITHAKKIQKYNGTKKNYLKQGNKADK